MDSKAFDMKKILSLILISLAAITSAYAQHAKKPTIMVVPSDIWCEKNGYMIEFNDQGSIKRVPDYKSALQKDSNIRTLISAMGEFMAQNDFPTQQLEQELKRLETENAEMSITVGKQKGSLLAESPIEAIMRTAKADIILDLDYNITRLGPKNQVSFNLQALDAYYSKIISGNTGVSTPASSSTAITTLLNEVVLNFKDNLIDGLLRYFDNMFAQGREITVQLVRFDSCPIDFEEEYEYNGQIAELADIIEVWFEENCVEGRYGAPIKSANIMRFNQVRMPLVGKSLSGKDVAMDARKFVNSLVNMLRKAPYDLSVTSNQKGLGEVWIYIGDKI